jgi:hypothetical protein
MLPCCRNSGIQVPEPIHLNSEIMILAEEKRELGILEPQTYGLTQHAQILLVCGWERLPNQKLARQQFSISIWLII